MDNEKLYPEDGKHLEYQLTEDDFVYLNRTDKDFSLYYLTDRKHLRGSIPVSTTGDYENTTVKLVLDSALKNIAPVQKVNQIKEKSEVRLLSEFNHFDEDDRA
jgi:hypothetical protein